ncbi:9757_t:CDS:10, partial [Entrophospora sp. SA101]
LYVDPARQSGFYPIPENFWFDSEVLKTHPINNNLVKRSSIPTLTFIRDNQFASKLNELPSFIPRDIYVVSDCQITRDLKVQPQGIKWPVYVENSSKYERLGYPFGYLIATQKDESSLDGLRQIFQNCKLDITAFSYRRPFTDGLDIYLRQITQTAVVKFDQIKEEVSANRLNIFKPIPMVEKTEFHDSIHTFLEQLELLGPTDPAYYGSGLNIVFELLSLRRIVRNMDSPYRGNYVEHNETTNIFWFTDGKNMSWLNKDLTYQGSESQSPSATIYKTKFRWDQKLYIFLITQFQNPQNPITEIPPPSLDWINMVMRQMLHAIRSILGIEKEPYKLSKNPCQYSIFQTCGVHLIFSEAQRNSSSQRMNHFVQLYVDPARQSGFYPIPENFWFDSEVLKTHPINNNLVKRSSIPTLTFIRDNQFASKLNELPSFIPRDIYVVSDCQITRDLKVQPQGIKWPVYVENSSKYERLGYPFGYLIATQKDESSLDGLRQIFQNCKLDITAFSYRRPFTDGLDIYLRQITQTAVVKFDQIKEEVSANRLNIFKPIPMVEKSCLYQKVGHSSLAKLTTIARAEFLNLLETQSEADPVHTLGTGDMGNYRDVIVKRKQSLLRDLYYDFDPNDKKKKDKRAFGSPFKNPDQKTPNERTLNKLPSDLRNRILNYHKEVVFEGSHGILPFKITTKPLTTMQIERSSKSR